MPDLAESKETLDEVVDRAKGAVRDDAEVIIAQADARLEALVNKIFAKLDSYDGATVTVEIPATRIVFTLGRPKK